eukprot:Colp12_sorted_trinity150504_noHs@24197
MLFGIMGGKSASQRTALAFAVLLALVPLINAQQTCSSFTDCAGCLTFTPSDGGNCGWCADSGTCTSARGTCAASLWYSPQSAVQSYIVDTDVKSEFPYKSFSVFLRNGQPLSFNVTVTPRSCKPLDLYFLLDVSATMSKQKAEIATLAKQIASVASTLCSTFKRNGVTQNCPASNDPCFRLGFGSFVEKPATPSGFWEYVNGVGQPYYPNPSVAPFNYAWKNTVSMTSDSTRFSNAVNAEPTRDNIDYPEAGLEGLVQASVCKNIVGWRSNAKHMLFYASDANSHLVGDGARVGAHRPSGTQCFLNDVANTDMSSVATAVAYGQASMARDYPSIGELRQSFLDNNIIPVLAYPAETGTGTTTDVGSQYSVDSIVRELGFGFSAKWIAGGATTDPASVTSILQNAYVSLTDRLLLTGSGDNLKYIQSITPSTGYSGIAFDTQYNFTVTLFNDGSAPSSFSIDLAVFGFGKVQVNVQTQTDCGTFCGKSQITSKCDQCANPSGSGVGGGDRQKCLDNCGICQCKANFTGPNCDCSTLPCPKDCSGRGQCVCGKCSCDSGYTGDACDCFQGNGQFSCSGHGTFVCGQCKCDTGYSGVDCSCASAAASVCTVGGTGGRGTVCGNGQCASVTQGSCTSNICQCDPGFGGSNCSCPLVCPTPGSTCKPGVTDCGAPTQGILNCDGTCTCLGTFSGVNCQCPVKDPVCPTDANGLVCSGHGHCGSQNGTDAAFCNQCICDPGFSGALCDCSSAPCPSTANGVCDHPANTCGCGKCTCNRSNSTTINGVSYNYTYIPGDNGDCSCSTFDCGKQAFGQACNGNGRCACGKCICKEGFTGDFCDCPTGAFCPVDLLTNQVCSGHGTCSCGSCKCDAGYGDVSPSDCSCGNNTGGKENCREPISGLECSGHGVCTRG